MKKISILLATWLILPFNVLAVGLVANTKIQSVYCGTTNGVETCSITFNGPVVGKHACHTIYPGLADLGLIEVTSN